MRACELAPSSALWTDTAAQLTGDTWMQLPNGWLWDMVDEFVYQFQSWQQYRGKLTTKSAEEIEALRSCDNVWSILSVLNYLQALADKSGITEELSTAGESPVGH